MLCIYNTHTDAYFNLAAEEYLLKNSQEDFFMLYRNEPSVIIGKYQHVLSEVNWDFVADNKIKIARRFSGGGAVFQDDGNLNITFIGSGVPNFDLYNQRIMTFLSGYGIQVETDERRALKISGLKISGSAQAIHKGRTLYHATLLFSSDLHKLVTVLESDFQPSSDMIHSKKYVKSVKSPVTNIAKHLGTIPDINDFSHHIMEYFLGENPTNYMYRFSQEDLWNINKLVETKYATDHWNLEGASYGAIERVHSK